MFIELHAQSAFSFLEGAEPPEAYAAAAARLEMPAVALCDRDGVYGAPRFTRAALNAGVKPIVGSELTLADGSRLPLLVEDREGAPGARGARARGRGPARRHEPTAPCAAGREAARGCLHVRP